MGKNTRRRFTTSDYLGAFGHFVKLMVNHRGDRRAIADELRAERDWARFVARHGVTFDEIHDWKDGEI